MNKLLLTAFFFGISLLTQAQDPASYVNPFIGTAGMGHCFPGACAPYLPYFKVTLDNGNFIEIKAPMVSDKKRYVKSVKINGKPYNKLFIKHQDLMNGASIEFEMDSKPNKKRGLKKEDKPYSMTK